MIFRQENNTTLKLNLSSLYSKINFGWPANTALLRDLTVKAIFGLTPTSRSVNMRF